MIMCVLLCYPVSIYMAQLLSTGRPISSFIDNSALQGQCCFMSSNSVR